MKYNGTTWLRKCSVKLDPYHNLCHVAFQLQHFQSGTSVSTTKERHSLRYFFPEEITCFLQGAGFRLLRLGAFPELYRNPNQTTWNTVAVAVAMPHTP